MNGLHAVRCAVRHLYVGLVLALSGNHRDGALQAGAQDCEFSAQFEEKRCRLLLNLTLPVCGGAVMLHYSWGNPSLEMTCGQPLPDTLVFWSIGALPHFSINVGVRICCELHSHSNLFLSCKPSSLRPERWCKRCCHSHGLGQLRLCNTMHTFLFLTFCLSVLQVTIL